MKKKEITEKGLLKKSALYALASKICASFLTVPSGLYLGSSIAHGDVNNIIISSAICVSVLAGAITAGTLEEKTENKLKELRSAQPRKVYIPEKDIIVNEYEELE